MRAMHGNGELSLFFNNVNGLQQPGKWGMIQNLEHDVKILVETHATTYTQTAFSQDAKGSVVLWGQPVSQRDRTGVMAIVKQSAAWAVQQLAPQSERLKRYAGQGRLMILQIFRQSGQRSMIVYVVHGHSGARWEPEKRKAVVDLLEAVLEDSVSRGDVATTLVGDMNVEPGDVPTVMDKYRRSGWHDTALWGAPGDPQRSTSTKGKGARIDWALVNATAATTMRSFGVVEGVQAAEHDRHMALTLGMAMPVGSQTWSMPKKVGSQKICLKPPYGYEDTSCRRDARIGTALQAGHLEKAYSLWCRNAEAALATIPCTDNSTEGGHGRGKVRLRRVSTYPPEQQAAAAPLDSRQLAKALRRAQELMAMEVFGHRAAATKSNITGMKLRMTADGDAAMRTFTDSVLGRDAAAKLVKALEHECVVSQRRDKAERIKAWKRRLQASEKEAFRYVKKGSPQVDKAMKLRDGSYTACKNRQLQAILDEWTPIFHKYKVRKPRVEDFVATFKPVMKSSVMQCEALTGEQLAEAARRTKPCAAGLDSWRPAALTALAHWCPSIYDDLARILNYVEDTGEWPGDLEKAYTSLIPKTEDASEVGPLDFRPITVLSAIYRLWAKVRFADALKWQEGWVSDRSWGCRSQHSAEQMAIDVALDLEAPAYEAGLLVGGVSYDFRKCFDLIPVETMLEVLRLRGASDRILRPLGAMYAGLQRVFRLGGALSPWWKSYGGIIQGDPLSMVGLVAMVNCILEMSEKHVPEAAVRAYADDISATAKGRTADSVADGVRRVHRIVKMYADLDGGEINDKKTFTYGDECARGVLEPTFKHEKEFRLVGGSIRTEGQSATELETQRLEKWKGTITKVRNVPYHWRRRTFMLLATQAQATFGQGTHQLGLEVEELKKVRTAIMRSLWKTDSYSCSPLLTFCLLAPPQLDPEFGYNYESLRTMHRAMKNPGIREKVSEMYQKPAVAARPGPVMRLRCLGRLAVYGGAVEELVAGVDNQGEWEHNLRESWRSELSRRLARERARHYAGATHVDRERTMALYNRLQRRANEEDVSGDQDDDEQAGAAGALEARKQLGVLRLVLAGGLMTSERNARHRGDGSHSKCRCGAEEDVMHVTWHCGEYAGRRREALKVLPGDIMQAPMCVLYAAVIPQSSPLTVPQVVALQTMFVDIWTRHIQRYHEGDRFADGPGSGPRALTMENGHALAPRKDAEGVWCRKCGKYVQRLQHVRLKITGAPCTAADLPEERWLQTEGHRQSTTNLDKLERELHEKYNSGGHTLTWNRQTGQVKGAPDEGRIQCTVCGRAWRWQHRTNNLPRTTCSPPAGAAATPGAPAQGPASALPARAGTPGTAAAAAAEPQGGRGGRSPGSRAEGGGPRAAAPRADGGRGARGRAAPAAPPGRGGRAAAQPAARGRGGGGGRSHQAPAGTAGREGRGGGGGGAARGGGAKGGGSSATSSGAGRGGRGGRAATSSSPPTAAAAAAQQRRRHPPRGEG